jgi:hypothetical protein
MKKGTFDGERVLGLVRDKPWSIGYEKKIMHKKGCVEGWNGRIIREVTLIDIREQEEGITIVSFIVVVTIDLPSKCLKWIVCFNKLVSRVISTWF